MLKTGPNAFAYIAFSEVIAAFTIFACGTSCSADNQLLKVGSAEFANNQIVPRSCTGEGADVSPSLQWSAPKTKFASFAIICEDPDAPDGTWVHWIVYDIPASQLSLPANLPKAPSVAGNICQGMNDFKRIGYNGPMPPPGKEHRYNFRVLALSQVPKLAPGCQKADFYRAVSSSIVAQGQLTGRYKR